MTLAIAKAPCEGRPHGPAAEAPPLRGALVLAATVLGSSIAFIDASALSVALPAIRTDLRASVADMSWVVNAYVLLLASLILLGGALGDRYGRRRVFVAGVALFALASLLCALAPDARSLIAARALKGVGGALLVPNSLAILSAAFPRETRGRAIGAWSGFAALTGAGGPVVGGWLVELWGWPSIFLLNLPIAAAAVLLAVLFVRESLGGEDRGLPLDWMGAGLATGGLGAAAFGLVRLGEGQRDLLSWGALAVGVAVFTAFLLWERRAESPAVPLELFRARTFAGVNAVTALLYAGLGGALFLVPFELMEREGYSATAAGAAFLPFSLPLGLLSGAVGARLGRIGVRGPLTLGAAVTAAALAGMTLIAGRELPYFAGWFWVFAGLGAGMTLVVAPLTTAVFNSVPDAQGGTASGVNNAVTRTAQLLAVAVFGGAAPTGGFRGIALACAALALAAAATAWITVRDGDAAGRRVTD
jgi:EmrB/QacA subfamily drug resistance transporter